MFNFIKVNFIIRLIKNIMTTTAVTNRATYTNIQHTLDLAYVAQNTTVIDRLTNGTIISLTQVHFDKGTIIIAPDYYIWNVAGTSTQVDGTTAGMVFRLTENISFGPAGTTQGDYTDHWTTNEVPLTQFVSGGGLYPDAAYRLGFFAAISLFANDVVIDMNGFNIEQTVEHSLFQRFYANIELSNIPFLPTQGPHTFGPKLIAAKNCALVNSTTRCSTLGRSSHHGIHGNNARDILIKGIYFEDYELSAMTVNGVTNFFVIDCVALGHRTDVHILGAWGAARMLRRYLNWIETNAPSFAITINTVSTNITTIVNALKAEMLTIATEVLDNNEITTSSVFQNVPKLFDGNSYGFSVHGQGTTSVGFPDSRKHLSQSVYFKSCEVRNHTGTVNEVPALERFYNTSTALQSEIDEKTGRPETDPVGAVFQTENSIDNTGKYIGNVISNAQAILAKAVLSGTMPFPTYENNGAGTNGQIHSLIRMTISQETINWIENANTDYLNRNLLFNGDSQFHTNKGLVSFKMDGINNSALYLCRAQDVTNLTPSIAHSEQTLLAWSPPAFFEGAYNDYKNRIAKSNRDATLPGASGNSVRGYSFSSSSNVYLYKCTALDIVSNFGQAIGMEFFHQTQNIYLEKCEVIGVKAGLGINDPQTTNLDAYNNSPESAPIGYGIKISSNIKTILLDKTTVSEITGLLEGKDWSIESTSATITHT